MAASTKVYIIYYSAWGHIAKLAKQQKEGVDSVPGCEGVLYQVKETLPPAVTEKMHIPPQSEDIPFIDVNDLPDADGFIFGFPTRFGNMAGQFKTFWDSTGHLWHTRGLLKKPFGIFTSTGSQGGGQEATVLTALSNFIHHGMIFITPGFSLGPELFSHDAVRGGSAWGAGTFAGDGTRQPTQLELDNAKHQGKFTAELIKTIARK